MTKKTIKEPVLVEQELPSPIPPPSSALKTPSSSTQTESPLALEADIEKAAPERKPRKPADYLIVKEVTVSRKVSDEPGTALERVLLLMPIWAGTDPDVANSELLRVVEEAEEGEKFRLFRLKRTLSKAVVSTVKLVEG